jgi:hypothetical protein
MEMAVEERSCRVGKWREEKKKVMEWREDSYLMMQRGDQVQCEAFCEPRGYQTTARRFIPKR